MKISDILSTNKISISLEVFPPKKDSSYEVVETAVKEIAHLKPSFISCTYGAGGGTSSNTVKISKLIQDQGVTSMAHLTCVSSNTEEVKKQIKRIHLQNEL